MQGQEKSELLKVLEELGEVYKAEGGLQQSDIDFRMQRFLNRRLIRRDGVIDFEKPAVEEFRVIVTVKEKDYVPAGFTRWFRMGDFMYTASATADMIEINRSNPRVSEIKNLG